MKWIKSNKTLTEAKQVCAGHKLELTKPIFYEYEGEKPRHIKFQKIPHMKSYKGHRGQVSVNVHDLGLVHDVLLP